MTPAARLHLAGNLRRSALNTREAVIDHLVATGAEALLAAIDATPAATITLLPIVGGKSAEDTGAFSISDPAFGVGSDGLILILPPTRSGLADAIGSPASSAASQR